MSNEKDVTLIDNAPFTSSMVNWYTSATERFPHKQYITHLLHQILIKSAVAKSTHNFKASSMQSYTSSILYFQFVIYVKLSSLRRCGAIGATSALAICSNL